MRRVSTLTALSCALVVVACGGTRTGSPPTGPRLPIAPVSGEAVFARDCTSCHSLIGNESLHKPGGDLIGYRLTRQELDLQIREMPVRRPLTAAELAAVSDYVWAVQHRR